MITKLIHDITQWGYQVTFNSDFEGMVTITYSQEHNPVESKKYIRHEHVGYPGSSPQELEESLKKSLSRFLSEVENDGEPQKDGLADK